MFRQMSSIGRNELLKSVVIILFLVGFMGIVIYEFAEMVTNEEKCIELQITVLDDEVAGAGSYTYVAMDGQPSNVSIYSYKKHGGEAKDASIGKLMEEILKIRQAARKEKNWSKADAIRDELAELGFEIQDAGNETKWRRK